MFTHTLCDLLTGYPKAAAIELATRVMNPQVIICDELGGEAETRALLSATNAGVPVIATAHAASTKGLLSRPTIKALHDNRVFDAYVGITRPRVNGKPSRCFEFAFAEWEDAL